jgi:hypothetical protein
MNEAKVIAWNSKFQPVEVEFPRSYVINNFNNCEFHSKIDFCLHSFGFATIEQPAIASAHVFPLRSGLRRLLRVDDRVRPVATALALGGLLRSCQRPRADQNTWKLSIRHGKLIAYYFVSQGQPKTNVQENVFCDGP